MDSAAFDAVGFTSQFSNVTWEPDYKIAYVRSQFRVRPDYYPRGKTNLIVSMGLKSDVYDFDASDFDKNTHNASVKLLDMADKTSKDLQCTFVNPLETVHWEPDTDEPLGRLVAKTMDYNFSITTNLTVDHENDFGMDCTVVGLKQDPKPFTVTWNITYICDKMPKKAL